MARRPKGSGTLRHLGDDRWQITIKVHGRRLSKVFRAGNATGANRAADAIRVELTRRLAQSATPELATRQLRQAWTVTEYAQYYFAQWAPHNLSSTTRRRYRQLAKNQVLPYLGDKRMSEVTPSDLASLYARLGQPGGSVREGRSLSGLTIWHVHRFIEAMFTFAIDVEGDLDSNPARKTRPRVSREARRSPAVGLAEVERFLAAVRAGDPELFAAVMIPAHIGTRRGETLALRWSDIDFDAETATIRRSCTRTQEDGIMLKTTKTGKSRVIPIDSDTIAELRSHLRSQRAHRLLLGGAWLGAKSAADDYVCADFDGSIMDPDRYSYRFRTHALANGFNYITPHVLRHAWISQMIALGFDAVTIASMSGHSPDVLLTTYAHAFDSRKREAMNALAEARRAAQ